MSDSRITRLAALKRKVEYRKWQVETGRLISEIQRLDDRINQVDALKTIYQNHLEKIKPFMAAAGLEVLERDGFWEDDLDGEPVTTTVDGRDCVFVKRDEDGTLKCAIENAYHAGALELNKPISCHLYPIRITKTKMGDALNYDRWDICSDACSLGEALKIPVYQFLKEPLIRKYGSEWYEALDQGVRE